MKAWVCLVILLLLVACVPQARELSFETIDQTSGLAWGLVEGQEPRLVVLTNPEEFDALDKAIPQPGRMVLKDSEDIAVQGKEIPYPQWRLQSVDWDAYFVIIAFQGRKSSGGYSVTIERIVQRGSNINIYARFKEPGPLEGVVDHTTSPLHAVQVKKDERLVGKELQFGLVVGGTSVVNTSHFIP